MLITSPAYMVMKAADEFKYKTAALNQLWQTDFTHFKVTDHHAATSVYLGGNRCNDFLHGHHLS